MCAECALFLHAVAVCMNVYVPSFHFMARRLAVNCGAFEAMSLARTLTMLLESHFAVFSMADQPEAADAVAVDASKAALAENHYRNALRVLGAHVFRCTSAECHESGTQLIANVSYERRMS